MAVGCVGKGWGRGRGGSSNEKENSSSIHKELKAYCS